MSQVQVPQLLKIEGLRVKGTGNAEILRGIHLQVDAGEKVSILGPSGAGKTTLFRAIVGLMPASRGLIRLDGVELTHLKGKSLRAQRCRIGFVAQKHDLVEALRVHHNVMAGALGRWSTAHALRYFIHRTAEERSCVQQALAAVGLTHLENAATSRLSGGEQQRVAIARALVQSPRLLLADEPVASLDPVKSREILELLVRIASERKMALLCILHQPHLAKQYFDRIVEVRDGMIVRDRGIDPSSRVSHAESDRVHV
jgi:phosphonate transport system ATP-binding protein